MILLNPAVWLGIWFSLGLESGRWNTIFGQITAVLFLFSKPDALGAKASRWHIGQGLMCAEALRRLNRLYNAAGSWVFLPTRVSADGCVSWVDQIVLITGGKSAI